MLLKVETSKSWMEKKGLCVNMGKTMSLVSSTNLDLLKKSGKESCAVCFTERVESLSSVMSACCGCTRNTVVSKAHYAQTLNLGAPSAWTMQGQYHVYHDGRLIRKCWLVMTSMKSSQSTSTLMTCSLPAARGWLRAGYSHMLQVCVEQVLPTSPSFHKLPFAAVDPRMGVINI